MVQRSSLFASEPGDPVVLHHGSGRFALGSTQSISRSRGRLSLRHHEKGCALCVDAACNRLLRGLVRDGSASPKRGGARARASVGGRSRAPGCSSPPIELRVGTRPMSIAQLRRNAHPNEGACFGRPHRVTATAPDRADFLALPVGHANANASVPMRAPSRVARRLRVSRMYRHKDSPRTRPGDVEGGTDGRIDHLSL